MAGVGALKLASLFPTGLPLELIGLGITGLAANWRQRQGQQSKNGKNGKGTHVRLHSFDASGFERIDSIPSIVRRSP